MKKSRIEKIVQLVREIRKEYQENNDPEVLRYLESMHVMFMKEYQNMLPYDYLVLGSLN